MNGSSLPQFRLVPGLPSEDTPELRRRAALEVLLQLLIRRSRRKQARDMMKELFASIASRGPITPLTLLELVMMVNALQSKKVPLSFSYSFDEFGLIHWEWLDDDRFGYFDLAMYSKDHIFFPDGSRAAVLGHADGILHLLRGTDLNWIPCGSDNTPLDVKPMSAKDALKLAQPVQKSSPESKRSDQ